MVINMLLSALLLSVLYSVNAQNSPCGPGIPPAFAAISGQYCYGGSRTQPPCTAGQVLQYQLCGTINATCGQNSFNKCSAIPTNCCGACQNWIDDDGNQQGACLGGRFAKAYRSGSAYIFAYSAGDPVDNGPREIFINVTCGSNPWDVTGFSQPSYQPNGGTYIYVIYAQSSYACQSTCSSSPDCGSCSQQSACEWCEDTPQGQCVSRTSSCQNWIRNPGYCPCTGSTCRDCLASPSCEWCLGQGCQIQTNTCTNGRVKNPALCPKTKFF